MNIFDFSPQMIYIIIFIVFVALVALLIKAKKQSYDYDKINFLFTPAEKKFLAVLEKTVNSKYRIYGKVRIADIVKPKKRLSTKNWWNQFARISSKHFDYVLCSSDKIEPLLVIELNDKSHKKQNRAKRDIEVDKICRSANLPILWVPAARSYNQEDLLNKIQNSIMETTRV